MLENIRDTINKKKFNLICYIIILLSAILFLYIGNNIAVKGLNIFSYGGDIQTIEAKVVEILDVSEIIYTDWFSDTTITFEAAVTKGEGKNENVTAVQTLGGYLDIKVKPVEIGDKVILSLFSSDEWHFIDYIRINKIVILGAVFVVLLLIFGRIKGLNAIISLCLTCAAIFAVFIPSLLSGKNIYISSVIVCVYSVVVTLFILNGVSKKSVAAIIGCLGSITIIGILSLFMNGALGLTGMISEESIYLTYLSDDTPIDLKAIIFAGIMIGAVGAVMDVAMSLSSALWELKERVSDLTFKEFFKSGVNIGKDIMGTMANTLVLAYIGSSLSIVLLLIAYAGSFSELLNRELVIVELLQAIIGSLGILITMPLTALICAALYSSKPVCGEDERENISKNL